MKQNNDGGGSMILNILNNVMGAGDKVSLFVYLELRKIISKSPDLLEKLKDWEEDHYGHTFDEAKSKSKGPDGGPGPGPF